MFPIPPLCTVGEEYQVWKRGISLQKCGVEYNLEKREMEEIPPFDIKAGRISRREKEKRGLQIWGRKSSFKK